MGAVSEWEQGRLDGYRDTGNGLSAGLMSPFHAPDSQYARGYATGVEQWKKLHKRSAK